MRYISVVQCIYLKLVFMVSSLAFRTVAWSLVVLYAALFGFFWLSRQATVDKMGAISISYSELDATYAKDLSGYLLSLGVDVETTTNPGLMKLRQKDMEIIGASAAEGHVRQQLLPFRSLTGGMIMAALLFLFVALRLMSSKEIWKPVTFATPPVLAAMLMPLVGTCTGCALQGGLLSTVLTVGLIALPLMFASVLWRRASLLWRLSVVTGSLAVLSVQAILLVGDPKLCLFCLVVSALTISALICTLRDEPLPSVKLRQASTVVLMGTVGLFTVSSSGVAVGLIKPPQQQQVSAGSFRGQPIASFLQSQPRITSSFVLITLPGCAACSEAKLDLRRAGLSFIERSFCGTFSGGRCFETDAKVLAPLLLRVDNGGIIVDEQMGWPSSREEGASLIRRLMPHTVQENP